MTELTREKAVSQCVEEAALLWLRREHLVGEPHLSLADFAARDGQLQARLDGLVRAGEVAWKACERELVWEEPGEIFPATFVALAQPESRHHLDRVLDFALRSYELSRPLVAALAWHPLHQVLDLVEDLLTADQPRPRRIGLAAAIAHRQVPESALATAVAHADETLCARALRGVGEVACQPLLPQVAEHLEDRSSPRAFEAAWTCSVRARLPAALATLREFARTSRPESQRAIAAVARAGPPFETAEVIRQLAEDPHTRRTAIIGAGALGDPDFVDWLIAQLADSELARVAGEAISMITGLSLSDPRYQTAGPNCPVLDDVSGPDSEPIEFGPDDNLPWPSAREVGSWWLRHRTSFTSGHRYLLGHPLHEQWCRELLSCGLQRQRAAAALELAIRRPDEPLFEIRAPGWRQQAWAVEALSGRSQWPADL